MAGFGVAAADIEARISGLTFGASSTPTLTAVTAMIADEASRVSGLMRGTGADPDSVESGDDGYGTARLLIIESVLASVYTDQGATQQADAYQRRADARERRLIEWAASLGDSAPSTAGSRGVPLIGTITRPGVLSNGGW